MTADDDLRRAQAATGGPDFTPKEWPEPRAEGLREALQAIIDLRTVVPDHAHGGIHPPYLEWLKVADIARRALAATPPAEGLCACTCFGCRTTHEAPEQPE